MRDPVDPGRVAVMKMRLPQPANTDTGAESGLGLPLWQRPVIDVLRDAGLATVTSLPIQPRDESIDDDDDAELAPAIPMPGVRMSETIIDLDHTEPHVPPLAMSESLGLASGTLRSDDDHHHTTHSHDHIHLLDDMAVIDLDDIAIDAEIVLDGPSAEALLERWSDDVSAEEHDRQEKLDGLYRRMADAVHRPRITFGPIDLRDEVEVAPLIDDTPLLFHSQSADAPAPLTRADDDHYCPQCGNLARLDIHDPMRGRIHLSCDSCFKMWQERVAPTAKSDEPFMRD